VQGPGQRQRPAPPRGPPARAHVRDTGSATAPDGSATASIAG
jgi:hypothetical protein